MLEFYHKTVKFRCVGECMAPLRTWDEFLSTHVSQTSKFVGSLRPPASDEYGRQPESTTS
jgi:hypothetical protein